MACGQAAGEARVQQRVWEGLTPCPRLGTQMVAVNSSSPTAACSGTWDTRGMEESVTTSDGNAESLYMQGTGQAAPRAPWGQGWRGNALREAQTGPRTPLHVLLCNSFPSPYPKTLIQRFPALSGQGTVSRNKSGLNEGLSIDHPGKSDPDPAQARPGGPLGPSCLRALLSPLLSSTVWGLAALPLLGA